MLLISSWKVFNAISFNAMYFGFGNFHTMETWKTMEFCFFQCKFKKKYTKMGKIPNLSKAQI